MCIYGSKVKCNWKSSMMNNNIRRKVFFLNYHNSNYFHNLECYENNTTCS